MNKPFRPPRWPEKLLSRFCRHDIADEIIGDLHEAFIWRAETEGLSKARSKYFFESLRSLKPTNLKSFHHLSLNTMIFRNYLKIAFRNLLIRKSFSFINIFGLATGVGVFVLIALYTFQILTFDHFHENRDEIYLAYKERITPDGTQATYDTWVPMASRLKETYSEIEVAAGLYNTEARIVKNNQFLEEDIIYTDNSFFDIFSFELAHGNPGQPFQDKNSIIVSELMALKYFNKTNAVGQSLQLFLPEEDTTMRFIVSGVLKDYPINTSLQPQLMIQMTSLPVYPRFANNWSNSFMDTYVKTPASSEELEAQFPNLVEAIWGEETRENTQFKLLPYEDYYDEFVGNKADARTLLFIGLGILLIAVINFMNLSTAQASQRSKEIGLRKVLGAYRGQLSTQFITEALVVSFLSTLLGLVIVLLSLPYFNEFFDLDISIHLWPWWTIVGGTLLLILILGLLSGSYPAFYLSSVRVLDVLRQKLSFGKSASLRNGLVIVQFVIAVFLISSTLLIRNQIEFMSKKNMGFDSEEIMTIYASSHDFTNQEEGIVRLNTFKNQLKQKSYIKDIALSRAVPTSWTRSFTFVRPDDWNGDPLRMRFTYVDANFFETYGISVKSGRGFMSDSEGDQRNSVMLNEAAMEAFEFETADDNVIKIGENRINVVGVVEDFHFESLESKVEPTLIFHRTANHAVHQFITCKIEMSDLQTKMEEIEKMWNGLGSTNTFNYSFMDDRIKRMYESEERFLGLISMFSIISIIIACLGLYGLTLFIIQKRRKELSIRKVLGAEVTGLLRLIFKDFAIWIGLAFIIGVPLVIYFINDWMQSFYYRTGVSWLSFGFTFLLMAVLISLTVGYQSVKAANVNPVKYLKDE